MCSSHPWDVKPASLPEKARKEGWRHVSKDLGQGMAQDMVLGTQGTGNRQVCMVVPALPMLAVGV